MLYRSRDGASRMNVISRRTWLRLIATNLAAFRLQAATSRVPIDEGNEARDDGSLLQKGWGIDHLRVAVQDLEKAKDQYRDALGFNVIPPRGQKGIHPTGSENSVVLLGEKYLELIAVHDREKVLQNRPWLIDFLKTREGAQSLVLNVSSAQETATYLRRHRFSVTDPVPGTIIREGEKEPPPPLWWTVDFQKSVLPGAVISFVEYAGERNSPERVKGPFPQHANTCKAIRAVWVVVADVKHAVKLYASIGLRPKRPLNVPYLGAAGHEVEAGNGSILLLQPTHSDGGCGSFLKRAGQGIMGVTLAATEIHSAQMLLAQKTRRPFVVYRGIYGESVLIPGELANGMWIEMYQI
jgi:hypothetical protein